MKETIIYVNAGLFRRFSAACEAREQTTHNYVLRRFCVRYADRVGRQSEAARAGTEQQQPNTETEQQQPQAET